MPSCPPPIDRDLTQGRKVSDPLLFARALVTMLWRHKGRADVVDESVGGPVVQFSVNRIQADVTEAGRDIWGRHRRVGPSWSRARMRCRRRWAGAACRSSREAVGSVGWDVRVRGQ
jgi:hypothetical protein